MVEKTHETYEEWFDVFVDVCTNLGYTGNFLKETWESDWEDGKDPFDVATKFVNEIND